VLDITIDLGQIPSVLAALENTRNAQLLANAGAVSYTDDTLDWIAQGRSFTPRTGALEQSINWRPVGNGAAEVHVNKDYGRYVEEGTRAHVIRPRPGRNGLTIPVLGGGGYIIRREVQHPGTQAKPFFFADTETRSDNILEQARLVLAGVMANG
jgi:hypothetical protein